MMFSLLPLSLLLFVLDNASCASPPLPLEPRDLSASTLAASSKLSSGWYPGWRATAFAPGQITWSKYNHIVFAFGTTTPDPSKISLEESGGEQVLSDLVTTAHKHNVTASIAIGGWSGSRYFSSAVGNAQNRTTFIKAMTDIVQKHDLDGIDFDWEFPNNAGVGCNIFSANDTPNFLSLLQELRQTSATSKLILTAAVFNKPWNDTSQNPITDVKGFADVLDYIEVMNYDVFNLWAPTAGPNAPLNDTCAPDHKRGSAVSAVELWTKAGIPKEKIVLGVPMYGRSFTVPRASALGSDNRTINLFPSYDVKQEQLGDSLDGKGPDVCGVQQPPTGLYTYAGLMDKNQLKSDGTVSGGMPYLWDECSQTNFIYNTTSQVYINYDDPRSFAVKGSFINDMGLKGFAAWDVTMDMGDALLNSILNSLTTQSSLNISGSATDPLKSKSNDATRIKLGSSLSILPILLVLAASTYIYAI